MATMYAAQREVTAALHEIGDVDLACRLERCMTARRGGELWPAVQGIGALARLDLDKLPDHLATLGGCEAGDRRQKRCFTIGRAGLGNVIDLLTAKQGQGVGLVIKAFLTLCLATALGGLGITARAANDPPNRTIDPNSPMTFEYTGTGGNIKGADWIAAEGIISEVAGQIRTGR
jgi:hypothetical protein